MKKPTELEVKMQFELKGVHDDLEHKIFYAHYESNDWCVGLSRMKSWKACVNRWILNLEKWKNERQKPKFSIKKFY